MLAANTEHTNEVSTMDATAVPAMENTTAEEHTETQAEQPHINIKAEEIFKVNGFSVTNSVFTASLIVVLFAFVALLYYRESQAKNKGLFFYGFNSILKYLYDVMHDILHTKVNFFFALLGGFFFFILLNNLSGLLPGVGSLLISVKEHGESHMLPLFRSGTADLNTTIALSLVSVIATQIFGFKFIGAKMHLGKYFYFKDPIMFFVGILELVLEAARIISFSFRLFGNIFAGEVLLTILPFLLPVFLSFLTAPMYFMEIFVGFIQAFVFVILTTIFINMATTTAEH